MTRIRDYENRRRIGRQVRQLREDDGMTLVQLAELSGLRQTTIRKIEDGVFDIGIDELAAIAQALGGELNIEKLFNVNPQEARSWV